MEFSLRLWLNIYFNDKSEIVIIEWFILSDDNFHLLQWQSHGILEFYNNSIYIYIYGFCNIIYKKNMWNIMKFQLPHIFL